MRLSPFNPQNLSAIIVSPPVVNILPSGTFPFAASGLDQFEKPMPTAFTWSKTAGGGTISDAGLYTAPDAYSDGAGVLASAYDADGGLVDGQAGAEVINIPTGPWHVDGSTIQAMPTVGQVSVTQDLQIVAPDWLPSVPGSIEPTLAPQTLVGTVTVSGPLGQWEYQFPSALSSAPHALYYAVSSDDPAGLLYTVTINMQAPSPYSDWGWVKFNVTGSMLQELHVNETGNAANEAIVTSNDIAGTLTVAQDAQGQGHVDFSTKYAGTSDLPLYVTITRTDGLWSQTLSGIAALQNIALPTTATACTFMVTAWLDALGTGVFAAPDRAATVNVDVPSYVWQINRNGAARAPATYGPFNPLYGPIIPGHTVRDLAKAIHLTPSEYRAWLVPDRGEPLPATEDTVIPGARTFFIPNLAVEYLAPLGFNPIGALSVFYCQAQARSHAAIFEAQGYDVDKVTNGTRNSFVRTFSLSCVGAFIFGGHATKDSVSGQIWLDLDSSLTGPSQTAAPWNVRRPFRLAWLGLFACYSANDASAGGRDYWSRFVSDTGTFVGGDGYIFVNSDFIHWTGPTPPPGV